MQLFNIGGEGQLYVGAILGAGAGHRARQPLAAGSSIPAMIVAGAAGGAALALVPAILRAFFSTNEIITSLMLNYVAALVLNYLIFDSQSYWRDTSSPTAKVFPQGKNAAGRGELAGRRTSAALVVPFGFLLGVVLAAGRLGALHAHAVRVRGAGDRRLAARGDATPACARAGRSSP